MTLDKAFAELHRKANSEHPGCNTVLTAADRDGQTRYWASITIIDKFDYSEQTVLETSGCKSLKETVHAAMAKMEGDPRRRTGAHKHLRKDGK